MAEPGRTLIVGPNWVGDMVMTEPVILPALNGGRRPSTVDVLAPGHLGDIVRHLPGSAASSTCRSTRTAPISAAACNWRANCGDSMSAPSSFRRALSRLIPFWAESLSAAAISANCASASSTGSSGSRHLGQSASPFRPYHHLAGVRPGRFPILAPDVANRSEILRTFGLADRRFVALFPGTEGGGVRNGQLRTLARWRAI